jgi:hypothetical protein
MKKYLYLIFLLMFLQAFSQIKNFNGNANFTSNGIHWSGTASPTSINDVVIQSGVATIIGSDNIVINNLTINSAATLQFIGPGKLQVTGNFQNDGTLLFNSAGPDVQIVGNVLGTGQFNCSNQAFKMSMLGASNTFSGAFVGNSNSTIIYGGGTQSLIRTDYFKLILTGSGIKSLSSGTPINIADSLIIDNTATFDFQTGVLLAGHLKNNGILQSVASPWVFNGLANQTITGNGLFNLNSLALMKSASSALLHNSPSLISVSNQLNLSGGVMKLQNGDLKCSGTINGTFGATSMIETNVGKFIKVINSNADVIVNYPLGYSGGYHEVSISSANIIGAGTLEMKINPVLCVDCANRALKYSTTGTLAISNIQFSMQFSAVNLDGAPTNVFKNIQMATGAPINLVTLPYTFGFSGSLASVAGLSGEWKLASVSPSIIKIERRLNPGNAISAGCASDKIVLIGQNLLGITNLVFNSTPLSFTSNPSGDSLVIDGIPLSGVSGTITVTTPSGTATIPYSVLVSPDPATVFSAPSSVCSGIGMPVEISNAQVNATYQVLFNNSVASSAIGTTSAAGFFSLIVPGLEMTTTGIYSTRLKITISGCVDTTLQNSNVTVTDGPFVSIGNSATKCASDISFNPTVTNADLVAWSGGAGSFLPNSNVPAITYAPTAAEVSSGAVNLSISASKSGCPNVIKNIVVSILPVPTATLVTGIDTVCQGSIFGLTINLTGVAPFTGLSLTPTIGAISNIASVSGFNHTETIVASFPDITYTLSEQAAFFKDALGCRGIVTGTHRVISEVLPTASIGGAPLIMCQGGNIPVSVAISGKHPISVLLSAGGNNFSGIANAGTVLPISVSPSISSTVSIVSVSSAHCATGSISGTVSVEVKPVVNASASLSSTMDTLCEAQTVNLEILTQTNVSYVCNLSGVDLNPALLGDGNLKTIPLAFANPQIPPGINSILVIATGCNVDTLIQTLTLKKSALVSNFNLDTINGTKLCGSNVVQLSTLNSFVSGDWSLNGADIVGANAATYIPLVPGFYKLTISDAFNCEASSKPVEVGYRNLKPTVTQTLISTYQTDIRCSISASQYYWYALVDGAVKRIIGENTSTYAANFDGTYYVSYPNNGCFIFSDPISITGKAGGSLLKQSFSLDDSLIYIPKLNWQDPITVYPNPINNGDKLMVSFLNSRGAEVQVELFSTDGTRISRTLSSGQGLINVEVSTEGLTPGLYFLRLDDGLKTQGSNLVVH